MKMKSILGRRSFGVVWVCIALVGLVAEAAVAGPNLISWWKFDGDANDSSGSNHGTVYGATWTTGQIDGALSFDGDGDFVDCGDIDEIDGTTNLTIAAWINTNSISVDKLISRKGQDGPPYYFWVRSDYTISFGIYRSTNAYSATTTETISPDEWFFVAGTYDGETVRTYINGIEKAVNTDPSGAANSNAHAVTIGYPYPAWPNSWFDGIIDDVWVYDRALSAGEIMELFAHGVEGRAFNPKPVYGAWGVDPNIIVSWSPGLYAVSHDVYFGTDYNDVNDATTSQPEYMGNQDANIWDSNNYDGNGLAYWTSYYWRVDEVNGSNIWKGDVWSFETRGDELIIAGTVTSGAEPIKNLAGVTMNGLPESPVTDGHGYYEAYVGQGWSGTVTPTKMQWDIPPKVYSNVQADMLSEDYTANATECLASTDPGYTYWSTIAGKPDCWCYRRQCRGDATGTPQGPYWVGSFDFKIMKLTYGKMEAQIPAGGRCADFSHTNQGPYRCGSFDYTILKLYYNKMPPQVPECPDTHINEWKN